MSKQPVMEALRRLSADGMIEIVPQVGCLVTGYDPHEIEDFYLGFGGFEGTIAGIAALRRTDRQLTELDADLRPHRCAAGRTRHRRPLPRLPRLNRRFHHAIDAMAHSRVMTETSRRMWDLSDFLINTAGVPQPLSSALDDRHADHERIRAALHAGDQRRARAEMERHIVTHRLQPATGARVAEHRPSHRRQRTGHGERLRSRSEPGAERVVRRTPSPPSTAAAAA